MLHALIAGILLMSSSPYAQDVRTADRVDLDRYLGEWHEVARFPNRFQEKCAGDVVAAYSRRDDGRIDVVNRCRLADGTVDEAAGVARTFSFAFVAASTTRTS